MTPIEALTIFISECADHLGMGLHSYIVGGAPRDYCMGREIKDIDVVVESKDGKDAFTLAAEVSRRIGLRTHPDKYGVCHIGPIKEFVYKGVSLAGQKVEIVTSRKEKYDRTRGSESHKPVSVEPAPIIEDLRRRDFTMNTLMWSLSDLGFGFDNAPVLDYLGDGEPSLRKGLIRTPLDPMETFADDPSRILRAIRFVIKYSFLIEDATYMAMQKTAASIRRLPYEAIDPTFCEKILPYNNHLVIGAVNIMDDVGILHHVLDMIPTSRMRRAILEHVKSARIRLELHWRGFDAGLKLTPDQSLHFREAVKRLRDDAALDELLQRFTKPLDVERLMRETNLQGAAIGRAVEQARNLVLLGLSDEAVFKEMVTQVS